MDRRFITLAVAAAFAAAPLNAQNSTDNPMGTVTYSLPQTSITLEVEAQKEVFHAGPYAKYAKKYLGVDAAIEDKTTYQLAAVKMTPHVEADQNARYTVTPGKSAPAFLQFSAQGLISTGDAAFGTESVWRFPKHTSGNFADKGVTSNYTSEATTLYRAVKNGNDYDQVAIQQNMVVAKTDEVRAKEASDMIFKLRQTRVDIITGETDEPYSGEALGAAIAEIARLEKEYMSLFIGYSDTEVQKMKFEVIPAKGPAKQIYVAFRLSETDGLAAADNLSGKPYILELVPQEIADAKTSAADNPKVQVAVYRIPAICTVKLKDGSNLILQDRFPVYQLGKESSYPLTVK